MYRERELIIMLDQYTPDSIHLASNHSLEQCWQDLLNRYANATAITSKVVKEYLDFKPNNAWTDFVKVIKLEALVRKTYRSLAVVGKLSQLTEVDRMLTHAMECLPPTHSDQVISLQYMNVQKPPKFQMSRWDVFYQFLKDKKASMQQFSHNVIEDFDKFT